jgi:hypothetical protein
MRLRPAIQLHDGRILGAEEVAAAIEAWARPGAPQAHLALPIRGAAERLAGQGVELGIRAKGEAIEVDLVAPVDLARWWAGPRAAIRPGGGAGSGPFRWEGPALVPFLGHRDGRPYLDRWRALPAPEAFGARAILGRAALVVDAPDLPAPEGARRLSSPYAPRELIFLSIGERRLELRRAAVLRSIEQVLGRERLARRYLGAGAEPAATISGASLDPRLAVPGGSRDPIQVTLLVPRRGPADRRFAERVQLDLVRASIAATLQPIDEAELAARRSSRDYELLLDRWVIEGRGPEPIDRLAQLAAFAAAHGRVELLIGAERWAAFARGSPAERQRLLGEIERRVQEEGAILPLASRTPVVWASPSLVGVELGAGGEVHLEDTFVTPEGAP